LFFLAGADLLELLRLLGGRIFVPAPVVDEVFQRGDSDNTAMALKTKKRGTIAKARPVLDRLRGAGMYLSDSVLDEALKLVGE